MKLLLIIEDSEKGHETILWTLKNQSYDMLNILLIYPNPSPHLSNWAKLENLQKLKKIVESMDIPIGNSIQLMADCVKNLKLRSIISHTNPDCIITGLDPSNKIYAQDIKSCSIATLDPLLNIKQVVV